MAFTPHTLADQHAMLEAIGVPDLDALFQEIPEHLRCNGLSGIPDALSEMDLQRFMQTRASQIAPVLNFVGAGAYDHFIPAAVWDITSRGEFMTAYTPYQAEASQGTLQLLYEYQTMMSSLMGLPVSNASLYDGATALAEAVLMAGRISKHKVIHIACLGTLNPRYLATLKTLVEPQAIQIHALPFDEKTGTVDADLILQLAAEFPLSAVVIQQPNYFGALENIDALTDAAKSVQALVIAQVNPMATALLKEPGKWGTSGADIACGDGQPLGIPLASGGPYFGFLCCRSEHVRQMPGRIIGRTVDQHNRVGYALTLQAREQHIRRGKATSNICTNQGLLVTAATIYMSLLGPQGIRNIAAQCHDRTQQWVSAVVQLPEVEIVFNSSYFHETVIRIKNKSVQQVIHAMLNKGFFAGHPLTEFPALQNAMVVCVTETKTQADITAYVDALKEVLV